MNAKIHVAMSGQSAGKPDLELLRDPHEKLLADARAYGAERFLTLQSQALDEALPRFDQGIEQCRARASKGHYRRAQMPVIEDSDLEDLKSALALSGIMGEICEACSIQPWGAIPTQSQIYIDKALGGTAKFGVEKTKVFLTTNPIWIDQDDRIIDGHHRWLSAGLIDMSLVLPALRIPAPLHRIMDLLLSFSDARHTRNL